jgi:hypothetical protein
MKRWMIDEEEDSHRIAGRRISPPGRCSDTFNGQDGWRRVAGFARPLQPVCRVARL